MLSGAGLILGVIALNAFAVRHVGPLRDPVNGLDQGSVELQLRGVEFKESLERVWGRRGLNKKGTKGRRNEGSNVSFGSGSKRCGCNQLMLVGGLGRLLMNHTTETRSGCSHRPGPTRAGRANVIKAHRPHYRAMASHCLCKVWITTYPFRELGYSRADCRLQNSLCDGTLASPALHYTLAWPPIGVCRNPCRSLPPTAIAEAEVIP